MAKQKKNPRRDPKYLKEVAAKHANRPLLSIGLIVKNEERCLERCLSALTPLRAAIPCQLVIADTGSIDRTHEIAEKYADVLFDFEWVNDFSAARNAVLDRCTGQWFLSLDADEYLENDVEELVTFLTGEESKKNLFAFVTLMDYPTTDMNPEFAAKFDAGRMVSLSLRPRYHGKIHESLPFPDDMQRVAYLSRTILHHDGYAFTSEKQRIAKFTRNMELLREEVKTVPESLRITRTLQCIESSIDDEETQQFIRSGVSMIQQRCSNWHRFLPAVYRHAVQKGLRFNMPEVDQWIEEAYRDAGDEPLISIDVSGPIAKRELDRGNYALCLEYLNRQKEGLHRFDAGDYDRKRASTASLTYATARARQAITLFEGRALAGLERWDEALEVLSALSWQTLSKDTVQMATALLLILWKKSEFDLSALIRKVWFELQEPLPTPKVSRERLERFNDIAKTTFVDVSTDANLTRPAYRLFALLGESCDLGRYALMMDTDSAEELQRLADQVENFAQIPPYILSKLVMQNAALPVAFFALPNETMTKLALTLCQETEHPSDAPLQWNRKFGDDGSSSGRLLWRFLLSAAAAQLSSNMVPGVLEEVSGMYRDATAAYLEHFCAPAVCTEENISVLPAQVRFGWHLIRAYRMLDAGDSIGFVRALRAGLESAPDLRDFVRQLALTVEAEESTPSVTGKTSASQPSAPTELQVTPEMMQIATVLREKIMAMKASNDPGLDAVLASPAYQMFKSLIEDDSKFPPA